MYWLIWFENKLEKRKIQNTKGCLKYLNMNNVLYSLSDPDDMMDNLKIMLILVDIEACAIQPEHTNDQRTPRHRETTLGEQYDYSKV